MQFLTIRGADVVPQRRRKSGIVDTQHVKIDLNTIKIALAAAAVNKPGRDRWMDIEERHLMLERRGVRVAWFVKNRDFTRKLGDVRKASYKATDQLTPSEARAEAKDVLADLKKAPEEPAPAGVRAWTWSEMVAARLKELGRKRSVGQKVKLPSRETQIDVRTAFGIDNKTNLLDPDKRPSLAILQDMKITELNAHLIGTAIRAIEKRRPREKFLTYAKTMLNWAYSNSDLSGLIITMPWWPQLEAPSLSDDEVEEMEAGQQKLILRKTKFDIGEVGKVLARSEAFCAGRTSNEKISPGIRFGIWWWALTANRRGSTAHLERANVVADDPFNDLPGWGSAFWHAGEMKGRKPFLIGVPLYRWPAMPAAPMAASSRSAPL